MGNSECTWLSAIASLTDFNCRFSVSRWWNLQLTSYQIRAIAFLSKINQLIINNVFVIVLWFWKPCGVWVIVLWKMSIGLLTSKRNRWYCFDSLCVENIASVLVENIAAPINPNNQILRCWPAGAIPVTNWDLLENITAPFDSANDVLFWEWLFSMTYNTPKQMHFSSAISFRVYAWGPCRWRILWVSAPRRETKSYLPCYTC